MKRIWKIVLAPLTLIKLLAIVFISAYVVVVGWIWLKLFGFSRRLQQWVLYTWGKTTLFFLGIKIDRNALPTIQNFILMPNHRSYLDIFIVARLTPSAFVGKAELAKWPLGAIGIKITNSILVNRKDSKSLINTMHRIEKSVKQGIPVTLFPEGTTHKRPGTKAFKKGSFKIAADAKIPVIPMAIEYDDIEDAWVDDDTFIGHFFRQMSKIRTRVTIRYGKPIISDDYLALQNQTKNAIDDMLTQIQKKE